MVQARWPRFEPTTEWLDGLETAAHERAAEHADRSKRRELRPHAEVMRRAGATLPEISLLLDVPVETIKSWQLGRRGHRSDADSLSAWLLHQNPDPVSVRDVTRGLSWPSNRVRAAAHDLGLTTERRPTGECIVPNGHWPEPFFGRPSPLDTSSA